MKKKETKTIRKTRADAKWNGLSAAKQNQLECWLFEDNVTYDDALAKAKTELGFTGSKASLKRFYKIKAQQRLLQELAQSCREAGAVVESGASTALLRKSGMKVLAQRFFGQMRDEGIADVAGMARLLLQSEANELQREERDIQRQGLELRRQRLEFQREKWQYDLMDQAQEMLPELQALKRAQTDREDPYAYNKRTNEMRRKLFGSRIPDILPENAQEEAAMAAAAAGDQERRNREYAERQARMAQQAEELARERAAEAERRREQEQAERPEPKWQDTEPDHYPFNDPKKVAELKGKLQIGADKLW